MPRTLEEKQRAFEYNQAIVQIANLIKVGKELKKYELNPENHKPSDSNLLIPYLFLAGSMIWALINSFVVSHFYKTFTFWMLLLGSVVVIPYTIIVTQVILASYNNLKTRGYFITVIIFHLSCISISVLCYFRVKLFLSFAWPIIVMFIMDGFMFTALKSREVAALLLKWSFGMVYRDRKALTPYYKKKIVISILEIYYTAAAFIITCNCLLLRSQRINEIYLYITMVGQGLTTATLLYYFVCAFFDTNELLGILLYIHNNKTENNNDGKLSKSKMESVLNDLNDIDIRTKFSMANMPSYRLKYGETNVLHKPNQELYLTSSWTKLFENPDIPVGICVSVGSFVYSMFYDVDMEEATRMCVSASYSSGYLELMGGLKLCSFALVRNTFDSLNAGILPILPLFIFIALTGNVTIYALIQLGSIALLFSLLTFIMLQFVITIVDGHTKALVYKFIEDPEEIVKHKRYGKRLNNHMKCICEMDKIV